MGSNGGSPLRELTKWPPLGREEIRAVLTQNDPATSCCLDLETGRVVTIPEKDTSTTWKSSETP
jgi:hypothetical protein